MYEQTFHGTIVDGPLKVRHKVHHSPSYYVSFDASPWPPAITRKPEKLAEQMQVPIYTLCYLFREGPPGYFGEWYLDPPSRKLWDEKLKPIHDERMAEEAENYPDPVNLLAWNSERNPT